MILIFNFTQPHAITHTNNRYDMSGWPFMVFQVANCKGIIFTAYHLSDNKFDLSVKLDYSV